MFIPSHEKSKGFLRSIGRVAKKSQGRKSPWSLFDLRGKEIERFAYWHELWIFILRDAEYSLHHDQATRLLISSYKRSNAGRRRKIRSWLADYNLSAEARNRISQLLHAEGFKPVSFEALPRTWRSRFRRVLRSEHGRSCLTYRASIEILRLDSMLQEAVNCPEEIARGRSQDQSPPFGRDL